VLSTSALFLVAGLAIGHFVPMSDAPNESLYSLSEITLFAVLFSDGMRTLGFDTLRRHWRSTGRVLLSGLPLVIIIVAVLAHYLVGLEWGYAFLIGAILAPTDPVFVSGIFSVKEVPARTKAVLNIESGFNDGLALPAVLLLMSLIAHERALWHIATELVLGILIGSAIPVIAIRLEQSRFFGASGVFERLHAFAIGLMVYSVATILNGNEFLAAFSAGITVVSLNARVHEAFEAFGEVITELLKLATLLIFGIRVSGIILQHHSWTQYLFVAIAVFLARPIAVLVVTIGSHMPLMERLIVGWFGPKGFASVVYGLMILRLETDSARFSARIVALSVAASIIVFSSSDVVFERLLRRVQGQTPRQDG